MNNNEFSLIKSAWSPFGMNPDNTGPKPISFLSGGTSPPPETRLPTKIENPVKINISNQQQAGKFPHWLFEGFPNTYNIPQRYSTISQYIRNYPPTPAGKPYRLVNPVYNSNGIQKNTNAYTQLLNRSGSYPEKLSSADSNAIYWLSQDISSNAPLYQVDGRDVANWLWERRGLQFTDEMWDNAAKARQDVTSQLGRLPQSMYYAWSDNNNTNAYSLRFNGDINKNNQYFQVFNPKHFDQSYRYDPYSGFEAYSSGTELEPWQQFLHFQDVQDHEASHAFNQAPTTLDTEDTQWVWDGWNSGYKDHMFFRKTNDTENPYYDDDTTAQRVQKFQDLFKGTYIERPSEYMGAMGRVKRYGAQLGFNTTSADPAKARAAMVQTLHYLTNHPKPEELSPEQQRLRSWMSTAADNGFESMKLKQKDIPKDKQKYKSWWDYRWDKQSPFYTDVLDFMTDATIQGLVRNDTPSNNATALQNLRYGYA